MKLKIEYEEKEGKKWYKGWDLIPENEEESYDLALVRDSIFFGLEDNGTYPMYEGREHSKEHPEWPIGKLMWRIPKPTKYLKAE